MTAKDSRGLTAQEVEEIEGYEPTEISLFIGGREFPLDGITLTGDGATLREALVMARDTHVTTLMQGLKREARLLEMTPAEARLFLGEQVLYLDKFIDELTPPE